MKSLLLGLLGIVIIGKIVLLLLPEERKEDWITLLKIIVALWICQLLFSFLQRNIT